MSDLMESRRDKLELLRNKGIDPFGARFETSATIKDLLGNFREGSRATIAGRIMAKRKHGKSVFSDMRAESAKIQIYVKSDFTGEEAFELFNTCIDIGDIIGVSGELFKTRTGEPTLKAERFVMLSKSLKPLPEKWHGLKDVETRYRHRYIDLIANHEIREVFKKRSSIIKQIRSILDSKGYLEVETPMMHSIAGGAAGKPFRTHHDALDMDLYLRIAPELYLKRLLVGGFERVYEINKSFRNEGISTRHNPEFTMLEVYTAYGDCRTTMDLTKEIICETAKRVLGSETFIYQGHTIDLSRWEVISFAEVMEKNYGIKPGDDEKVWIDKLKTKGVEIEGKNISRTQVANIIADLIEPKSNHPVFVVDIFTVLCPLAKTKKDNPLLTDRFELFLGGMEIANAYSELNDPLEQRKRLLEQNGKKIDEDFINALEHGMPPAGGLGIGIDRLVMLLTDSPSIRDVILFPQLRKEID